MKVYNCYQTRLFSWPFPYSSENTYKYLISNDAGTSCGVINADILKWDTQVLGFLCARINFIGIEWDLQLHLLKEGILDILLKMRTEGIKCCDCRVDMNSFKIIHLLENCGFYLMDVLNIYWISKPAGASFLFNQKYSYHAISIFSDKHRSQLFKIAKESFKYSRLYQDDKIPEEKADYFYERLLIAYINNKSNQIIVAVDNMNDIIGFLVGNSRDVSNSSHNIAYLWMIAVDKKLRGQGIGSSLLNYFLKQYSKEFDYLEVGTQVNNFASNELYTKKVNGKLVANVVSLHKWLY